MFGEDGAETLELQAQKIARNTTLYRGSSPCPQCGIIMNPVEYMQSLGLCQSCDNDRRGRRMKTRLV
jgi:ribosomal protein S14